MKKKLLLLLIAFVPFVAFADNLTLWDTIKDKSTGLSKDDVNFSGNGVTEFTEKGEKVYIYTGNADVINNFVRIDNMCFTILRTTYTKGVKLLYYGTWSNGTCVFDQQQGKFNDVNVQQHPHVGYMYGSQNDESAEISHENVNESTIKGQLDTFYTNKLKNYDKWMGDDIYCNDRDNDYYAYGEYSNEYKYYTYNYYVYYDLECRQQDSFTQNNEDGNKKLTKPIGTISVSEYMLTWPGRMGSESYFGYDNNWLYKLYGKSWTMTASYTNGWWQEANNRTTELSNHEEVNQVLTVIPSISVNKRIFVKAGTGKKTDPYELYYDDGSIHGQIVWVDENNADGIRPEKVVITVFADENPVDHIDVTAENDWRFTIRVEEYNSLGNRISYRVGQDDIDGYELDVTGSQADGFILTNTHGIVKGVESNPKTGNFRMILLPLILLITFSATYFVVRKNDLFKSNYKSN